MEREGARVPDSEPGTGAILAGGFWCDITGPGVAGCGQTDNLIVMKHSLRTLVNVKCEM